jgi:hypothetical protein
LVLEFEDEEERGMKSSFRRCTLAVFWFATASLHALQAGAQDTVEYDRNGPYLMVGGGYSLENFKGASSLNIDDSPNVIASAGWRIHPRAAVDLGFEWNEGFDTNTLGVGVELETYLVAVGMKFFAMTGRFQPFLHPSIGVMEVKINASGPGSDDRTTPVLRGGGGFDFYVTENLFVSFSASYVLALRSEVNDVQYVPINAAVGWRF